MKAGLGHSSKFILCLSQNKKAEARASAFQSFRRVYRLFPAVIIPIFKFSFPSVGLIFLTPISIVITVVVTHRDGDVAMLRILVASVRTVIVFVILA